MNKQDLKALLMKIETMYDTATDHTNFEPYNVYNVTRHLINMIEESNSKEKSTKVMLKQYKLHAVKNE